MSKPILLVMAAGLGSRFGGLKQMEPVGAHGESLIDYSLFDARRAGFERVVFLINRRIEQDFRQIVGRHVENRMEVRYAFQEMDAIPAGCTPPAGRQKPYGTGHAVLCCRALIDAPFCAINGDDFYGRHAFRVMHDQLLALRDGAKYEYVMVGYELEKTLTDNGHVARGVCRVDGSGLLAGITERTHIIRTADGPLYTEDGQTYRRLPGHSTVSMNLWGFTTSFMEELAERFPRFFRNELAQNPLKAEFFLPFVVGELLDEGKARVRVLPSPDQWYGMTYQADRAVVRAALDAMTRAGEYPVGLWRA